MQLYQDFNFSKLNSPDFKEDSVREELIVPLLRELGYSASGPNKITRSKSLIHPSVSIGSKKHKIYIIPDYLLEAGGKFQWVLDAKAPSEDIRQGENVEQVYSYAIHKDIRVNLYALCNGNEFTVFHISELSPLLQFNLRDIEKHWDNLYRLVSPVALTNPKILNYKSDFGIHLLKMGFRPDSVFHFLSVPIFFIGRTEEDTFTMMPNIPFDETYYAISFDFDRDGLNQLINLAPDSHKELIVRDMRKFPFRCDMTKDPFYVNIEARLGDYLHEDKDDTYLPLWVINFTG